MKKESIAVIIPALNESGYLPDTLDNLRKAIPQPDEIIVVDGGSTDNTVPFLEQEGVGVIRSQQASRPVQMNLGASRADSGILVFLHADTVIPENFVDLVRQHLSDPGTSLGGFTSIMAGHRKHRIISGLNDTKTWLWPFFFNPWRTVFHHFRILFGDQVMFCRKKDLDQAGGFNEAFPVLEDAELCIRMNRLGRVVQFPEKVYSSDRRVANQSTLRALWIYFIISLGWTLRIPPRYLGRLYHHIR